MIFLFDAGKSDFITAGGLHALWAVLLNPDSCGAGQVSLVFVYDTTVIVLIWILDGSSSCYV